MSVKVPMISRARHWYGGRWLSSGEPFIAETESDAADLVAINFAHRDQRAMMAPNTMVAVTNSPVVPPAEPAKSQRGRRRGVYNTKAKA